MKSGLINIDTHLFVTQQDLFAFEKAKHKNLNFADVQRLKRMVDESWSFHTHKDASTIMLKLEAQEQKGWSYGFSFKQGLTREPRFGTGNSVTRGIPSTYKLPQARERMNMIAEHAKKESVTDVANTAALYVETNYYLVAAIADQTRTGDKTYEHFIDTSFQVMNALDDKLRRDNPAGIVGLDDGATQAVCGVLRQYTPR